MDQKEVNRKLSCIFSTDVVGYSHLMEENEASTVKYLEENKELISKLIGEYHGRVVDSPGDNLLAEFNSAVKAVDCAVKVQRELKIKNAELVEKRRMQFRIGINLGDVIDEDGNLYGNGVNIAARLEGLAQPGGIYISRNVFDQVKAKLDLGYKYLGEHNVKNISEPVRIYRVLIGDKFAGKVIGEKKSRGRIIHKVFRLQDFSGYRRVVLYSPIIILLIMAGAVLIYQRWARQDLITKLPSRINLAILPFETINLRGDSKALAIGLIVTMNAQLTKLSGRHPLQVISAGEIRDKNIHTVEEAYREFGANLVMEGSLQQVGEQVRINYIMVDAKTKQGLRGDSITAAISNAFNLMDRVVVSVLSNLGINLLPEEENSIAVRTTRESEAYNYYMTAVGYLQEYQRSENIQNAVNMLQYALDQDPKFAEAYAALGEARWRQYKYEKESKRVGEALSACNRALELDSNLANGHVCLGIVFTGTGKYEQAVEEFKHVLDLEPTSDEACRGLGSAYEHLGLFNEAEKIYSRAINLKPEYWAGYSYLGALYLRQGRYREAAEQFTRVTQLVPDHHYGYSNLGCVYLADGQYPEAIRVLQRSLAIRPTLEAFCNIGTAYFYLRKFREAAAAFEKAIGLNDKDWIIWGNLGDARYWDPANRARAGEAYRKALTLGKQKLQVNPRDSMLLSYMAYYHAMLDEKEAAQKYVKLALAENPQDRDLFFNLAQTCCRLGDKSQALDWLKKATAAGLSKETIQNTPLFDSLRKSQGFKGMLKDN